jgi:hypothetical protein
MDDLGRDLLTNDSLARFEDTLIESPLDYYLLGDQAEVSSKFSR